MHHFLLRPLQQRRASFDKLRMEEEMGMASDIVDAIKKIPHSELVEETHGRTAARSTA
jgi:hypothetical protein